MRRLAAFALAISSLACGTDSDPTAPPGPRTFVFVLQVPPDPATRFVAVTSDPGVLGRIEAQLRLPAADRHLHIHGPIARGDGGHNTGWTWHFVPGAWDVVELSAEVCDGTPGDVEKDPDYWVDQVGSFCPWSSYVEREI